MLKKFILQLPEYYFIIMIFFAGYTPPFSISWIYILLIAILVAQLIFKNKTSGLLLGGVAFFINLLFIAALFSELKEFKEFNVQAQKLLFVGLGIWIFNMIASITMIYRYVKMKTRSSQLIKFS